MSSTSESDYRNASVNLVQSALRHPRMYFDSLGEFEVFLRGYDTAYGQLLAVDREDLFHSQFSDWLHEKEGLSCASGWAVAIEEQCTKTGEDTVLAFGRYVNSFFTEWSGKSAG